MNQDGDDTPDRASAAGPAAGVHLRRLPGQGGASGPDELAARVLREFKGLTVRDLVRESKLTRQLPGRVRSALHHLTHGDLAAAEDALPGRFAPVIPGPGHATRAQTRLRRSAWLLAAFVGVAAMIRMLLG